MVYIKIIELLTKEKEKLENYVTCGQILDFASYRFYVGQIKGLNTAIEICKDTYKRGNADE